MKTSDNGTAGLAPDDLIGEPPSGPLRRVLAVDDDRDALRIIGDFLEAKGWGAASALDGHEALARFHDDGPFDAIILDVMMPGIDGMEVCRRLKASPQGQLTPVLLLSARADTRSRIAGLYGGADDYMTKPVDLRELAARLEVLFRVRDRYLQLANRTEDALDAAMVDGLSGAMRYHYFLRRLSEEIPRADRYNLSLTVLVIDIEGLPEPEQAGDPELESEEPVSAGPADKLIASAGQVMSAQIRVCDKITRVRRSRFAIMLPHTSRKEVRTVIARLEEVVAKVPLDPRVEGSPGAGLYARIGSSELGRQMDASTLIARAEPR